VTRRTLRLTAVAALAVAALTGCQTHQGTAAYVGDTRITQAEVEKQADAYFSIPFVAEQSQGSRAGGARAAVQLLILDLLSERALAAKGQKASAADLRAVADIFEKQPNQVPRVLGGGTPQLSADVFVQLSMIAGKPLSEWSDAEVQTMIAAIQEAERENPVTLNPRYGSFTADAAVGQLGIAASENAGVRELKDPNQAVPGEEPQPDQPPQN
jgi:hypothetical protein